MGSARCPAWMPFQGDGSGKWKMEVWGASRNTDMQHLGPEVRIPATGASNSARTMYIEHVFCDEEYVLGYFCTGAH